MERVFLPIKLILFPESARRINFKLIPTHNLKISSFPSRPSSFRKILLSFHANFTSPFLPHLLPDPPVHLAIVIVTTPLNQPPAINIDNWQFGLSGCYPRAPDRSRSLSTLPVHGLVKLRFRYTFLRYNCI